MNTSYLPGLQQRGSPVRARSLGLALALVLLLSGWALESVHGEDDAPQATEAWKGRWSEEALAQAAIIPVQSQGRVKPLHTWAGYALLSANHRRSCKDAKKVKLTPLEWWLDVVFRPEQAKHHRCFLVATSEVLDAIGLPELARKKRDRYSYADLAPDAAARERILLAARDLHRVEAKERTRVEEGVVTLEQNLRVFEGLSHLVDFARASLPVAGTPALRLASAGPDHISVVELLRHAPELLAARRAAQTAGAATQEVQSISSLFREALTATQRSQPLGLFPPESTAERVPEWLSVDDVVGLALTRGELAPPHLEALEALAAMTTAVGRKQAFLKHITDYRSRVALLAEERGEYGKIEQEVAYYELDPFGRSQVFYLIAFALLALTWLPMPLRWLELVAWALLWGTLALHSYGIVQRCLIRGRPPITGLYDTVLFISAAGVLCTLVIEHMGHRKVALALTPIVGAVGLFIAGRYEVLNGTDTMPQLVAVLDTNFWLATHVTCISIGYGAGLIAGLIAHVYVLGRLFHFKRNDQAFYRDVGKMVYGTLCFALLFSLVGTILGGIWANDSWGRFWGWDPKENGALLICITQLAILHGRMAGLFGTFGVCQGAILGGVIVAFSWWGVNLLGIGLHSYGFTTGIMRGLLIFYGIEGAVILAGFVGWVRDRRSGAVRRAS